MIIQKPNGLVFSELSEKDILAVRIHVELEKPPKIDPKKPKEVPPKEYERIAVAMYTAEESFV